MKEKYNLTGEEVNQILAHSPFALSDSPYQKGMGAAQIKKYFYDFITVMAEKFNIHLSDIETDMAEAIQSLEGDILTNREELTAKFTSLIENRLLAQIGEHNENSHAHTDIRNLIYQMSSDLNDTAVRASNAYKTAENAYSLASGKSKVHVALDFRDVLSTLMYAEVNIGDFMIATDKNCPDFIVGDGSYKNLAVTVTFEDVAAGNLPTAEVGGIYYCEGVDKALIAIESGIDASVFAEREELNAVASGLASLINNKQDKLTFDTKPTPDSENPITSGGVRAEFAAFSEVYDDIIEGAKNEAVQKAKSYTDEKIQEVSSSISKKEYEEILTYTVGAMDEVKNNIVLSGFELSSFYVEVIGGFESPSNRTVYVDVNDSAVLHNITVGLRNPDDSTTEKDKEVATRGFYFVFQVNDDGSARCFATQSASSKSAFNAQIGISKETYLTQAKVKSLYSPITKIMLCSKYPDDVNNNWWAGTTFKLWGIKANEG